MASARLDKLKSLLKRIEERRARPRLHAVATPRAAAPVAPADEEEDFPTVPPIASPVPARPAAAKSPLDDAIDEFGSSGPLDVRALSEPITTPKAEPRTPEPAFARAPEPLVTYRPEPVALPARPSMPSPGPLAPVVPLPFATASTNVSSKVTLEFGLPRIELPAPPGGASAPPGGASAPPGGASVPTQTIEPTPLAAAAAPPARAVSPVRVEAPRSFGELLELSLGLRPR